MISKMKKKINIIRTYEPLNLQKLNTIYIYLLHKSLTDKHLREVTKNLMVYYDCAQIDYFCYQEQVKSDTSPLIVLEREFYQPNKNADFKSETLIIPDCLEDFLQKGISTKVKIKSGGNLPAKILLLYELFSILVFIEFESPFVSMFGVLQQPFSFLITKRSVYIRFIELSFEKSDDLVKRSLIEANCDSKFPNSFEICNLDFPSEIIDRELFFKYQIIENVLSSLSDKKTRGLYEKLDLRFFELNEDDLLYLKENKPLKGEFSFEDLSSLVHGAAERSLCLYQKLLPHSDDEKMLFDYINGLINK